MTKLALALSLVLLATPALADEAAVSKAAVDNALTVCGVAVAYQLPNLYVYCQVAHQDAIQKMTATPQAPPPQVAPPPKK